MNVWACEKGEVVLCKWFSLPANWLIYVTLRWRHNGRDSVSNHQHYNCLLNRLFRRISIKTSKLRITQPFIQTHINKNIKAPHHWPLCGEFTGGGGGGGGPVNSPHKWPVTRKMFPFDDVIMRAKHIPHQRQTWIHYSLEWLSAYTISHKMLTYHISFIFEYV